MLSLKKLYEEYMSNLKRDMESKRKDRAKRIQIEYKGLSHRFRGKRIRTAKFEARDPQGSGKKHMVRVQIPELREIIKQKKNQTLEEAIETSLKAGNINVGCSCSDNRYVYSYLQDVGDFGIAIENRPPEITNPDLDGTVCKHIGGVFNQINKFIPDILVELKTHLLKQRKQDNIRKRK